MDETADAPVRVGPAMWRPGIPSCLVRFICGIPTFAAGMFSVIKYSSLAGVSTELVDALENGNALVGGFHINGIVVSYYL